MYIHRWKVYKVPICLLYDCLIRLSNLLGYTANDIIGHVPFEFHHHNDINVTLDCSKECKHATHYMYCIMQCTI